MKILVVGRGGREHAIAWALHREAPGARLFAAPGNPGTAQVATNLPIVSRAVYEAGFGSGSRVYEASHRLLGTTPGRFKLGGRGMDIRYSIVALPHGRLLVGATDRGVAAVLLGDTDAGLARDLRAQFPAADIARVNAGDAWLRGLVRRVDAEVRRPGSAGVIPLDLQGTAFQWKVWQALPAIPAGQTRTYAELARSVGRPRAIRAVASSCAANRVAVLSDRENDVFDFRRNVAIHGLNMVRLARGAGTKLQLDRER